jgi:hypothetical protein
LKIQRRGMTNGLHPASGLLVDRLFIILGY